MSTPPLSDRFEFPTTVRAGHVEVLADHELNESGLESAPNPFDDSDSGPPTEQVPSFAKYECISNDESWVDDLFRIAYQDHTGSDTAINSGIFQLPEIGARYFGFNLLEELGRGAMGNVYLAHQEDLTRRPVAVKVSRDSIGEIQNLTQLQHTNVMPIYSVHDAPPFTVVCMPFLGRTTFSQLLRWIRETPKRQLSGAKIVENLLAHRKEPTEKHLAPALRTLQRLNFIDSITWLMTRVTEGLAHAHEHGILHLDLKPANILLADHGQPLLLDFNVSLDVKPIGNTEVRLVGGTLQYMSRNQLLAYCGKPQTLDCRSDIYALGLIFYELLSGRHVFESPSGRLTRDLYTLVDQRSHQVPRLRPLNSNVSPALESIVLHCLAPHPEDRYQSAHELLEDLDRHSNFQSLRFAVNPSVWERVFKSIRRAIRR